MLIYLRYDPIHRPSCSSCGVIWPSFILPFVPKTITSKNSLLLSFVSLTKIQLDQKSPVHSVLELVEYSEHYGQTQDKQKPVLCLLQDFFAPGYNLLPFVLSSVSVMKKPSGWGWLYLACALMVRLHADSWELSYTTALSYTTDIVFPSMMHFWVWRIKWEEERRNKK